MNAYNMEGNRADGAGVKALVFDMDGLMYDSELLSRRAYHAIAERRGFELPDSLIDSTVGFICSEARAKLQEYFDSAGIDADANDVYSERNALILEMVGDDGAPEKPGLHELIGYARGRGMKLAVASSSGPARVELFLCKSGLTDSFDVIVSGGDVKRGKPDPEIFLLAAERLGLTPAECLVLEDSANGMRAAAAAGMPVIVVPDLMQPPEDERHLAAAVLPSLEDVISWLS
jgi:HAD superfamily hydrolase (TIGR01509 family)